MLSFVATMQTQIHLRFEIQQAQGLFYFHLLHSLNFDGIVGMFFHKEFIYDSNPVILVRITYLLHNIPLTQKSFPGNMKGLLQDV